MKEEQLSEALRGLFKLLDDGDLVRNIEKDGDVVFFMRQGMRITKALKAAQEALEAP